MVAWVLVLLVSFSTPLLNCGGAGVIDTIRPVCTASLAPTLHWPVLVRTLAVAYACIF